jgi:hypothetical protein
MTNPEQQLYQVVQQRKQEEDERGRRYDEQSRKRLLRILEKKMTTCFIGAISKFETYFGVLWGHGKDEADLTAAELEWRDIWNVARTAVLNNGNNQLRAVQSELVQYTMTWNRYETNLPVLPPPA